MSLLAEGLRGRDILDHLGTMDHVLHQCLHQAGYMMIHDQQVITGLIYLRVQCYIFVKHLKKNPRYQVPWNWMGRSCSRESKLSFSCRKQIASDHWRPPYVAFNVPTWNACIIAQNMRMVLPFLFIDFIQATCAKWTNCLRDFIVMSCDVNVKHPIDERISSDASRTKAKLKRFSRSESEPF